MRLATLVAGFLLLAGSAAYAASPVTIQDPSNVNLNLSVNADHSINVTCVSGCSGGGSGGDVNLTGINGVTPLAGAGATGTGSPRTTQAQDTSTVAGAAPTTTGIYVTGPSAAALATAANQTTANTSLATIATNSGSAIPAGSAIIGKVGIDQTTPGTTNGVVVNSGTLTSSTAYGLQSAASTNATNVKNAAGVLTGMTLENTTTTVYYLRMYNLASAPTCSSATGFVRSWPIPPAASAGLVGGITPHLPVGGSAFSTGISFCLTGGGSSTDNTNAATGVYVNLDYQ